MALKPHKHNDSLPSAPYGSEDDTRYNYVPTLAPLPTNVGNVPETTITDTFDDIIPVTDLPLIEPTKQVFRFSTIIGTDIRQEIPFNAQSFRVDNLTNYWVFFPNIGIFVPPDWFGAIFIANGLKQISMRFQAPPGLNNGVATPNTIVNIVAYFERQPSVAGVKRL